MLTVYRTLVTFYGRTGDSDDVYQNEWHFEGLDGGTTAASDALQIRGALHRFYNVHTIPGSNSIMNHYSEVIDPTQTRYRTYNLLEPKPRTPVLDEVIESGTPAATPPFPSEVAVVLSYRQTPVSGLDRERSRGRIFVGPLTATYGGADGVGEQQAATLVPLVNTSFRGLLVAAADLLVDELAVDQIAWTVFSKADAGPEPWTIGELLAGSHRIDEVRVDPNFDTQRRRGERDTPGAWTVIA